MRLGLPVLAALVLAVLLVPVGASPPVAEGAKPLRISLSVVHQKHSDARLRHATLLCEGKRATASGWLAYRPKRACQAARRQAKILLAGPEVAGSCLTAIYGDQRGRVWGTVGSRGVDRRVSRVNSCEERVYEALKPLMPKG